MIFKVFIKVKKMNYQIRPATVGDSRFIAEMIGLSSSGIASLDWHLYNCIRFVSLLFRGNKAVSA